MDIAGTKRTPRILIDGSRGIFEMSGESMPEDLRSFFDPVLEELVKELSNAPKIEAKFSLIYFNSASARAIFDLIMRFDSWAGKGSSVKIFWIAAEDDDTMREYGEDFSIHIKHADLKILAELEMAHD